MRFRNKGFTLIELLVVIAIIAILAALLMPVFAQVKERARMTNSVANFRQIHAGISMYRSDHTHFPPFLASLYRGYVKGSKVYICKSDRFKGKSPFNASDWENGVGFETVWKLPKMGCSYPYIPRAGFWFVDVSGKRGLWKGTPALDNKSWVNTASWEPVFDHFTPIIFDWWHAQDAADPITGSLHPVYRRKAFVLVLTVGGSVLRCDHERQLPCAGQIGTAKHPREVLH